MPWFQKDKTIEQDTDRWRNLHDCLQSYSNDMLAYRVLIDGPDWDLRKIQMVIAAVETDLRLAERIWPEGKPILVRMRRWFSKMVQVREEEHKLNAVPIKWDTNNPEKSVRESTLWNQVDFDRCPFMDRGEGVISAMIEFFSCCN